MDLSLISGFVTHFQVAYIIIIVRCIIYCIDHISNSWLQTAECRLYYYIIRSLHIAHFPHGLPSLGCQQLQVLCNILPKL